MKPRVLIIDPSLRSAGGHHLGLLQAFRRELGKLQLTSVSLVSRFASEELCREFDLVATFEKSLYYRSEWTRTEYENAALQFQTDLREAMRGVPFWPDIVIFPGADQVMALGFARFLKQHRFRKSPQILLWLGMPPHYKKAIDEPSVAPLLAEYEEAFAALRQAAADDRLLHVCCEEEPMAIGYGPRLGLPVETVLVPKLIEQPRGRRVRQPGEPINIVCAGNANVAKGYALLPEAIHDLNRQRSDLRFLIQGTVDQTDDPEGAALFQRIAAAAPNVTVRTEVLAVPDYLAWLTQADLVLQPYDPAVYSTRRSGIFVEATKLGIPVVATQSCEFAGEAIAQGRAIGIGELTAEGVAKATLVALDRLEEITERAARHASSRGGDTRFEALLAATASAAAHRRPEALGKIVRRWLKRVSAGGAARR